MVVRIIIPLLALFLFAFSVQGCGDSDTGGDGSGSGSGSGNGSGAGNGSGSGAGNGSGSGMNCDTARSCINGACECTTAGREGTACCDDDCDASDPNHCDTVCRVCS